MSTQPHPRFTVEEYLEFEEHSESRHEYIAGVVCAMAGGTLDHGQITSNTLWTLLSQLRDGHCRAIAHELKVYFSAFKVFTYPDIVVLCGPPKFYPKRRDVITDATVIVEALQAVGALG